MEIVLLVLGLLGFGLFQLKKRKEAEVDGKLAETKGKDVILSRDQLDIEQEVNKVDKRLKQITEERKKQLQQEDTRTLEQRTEDAKKRFN